MKLDDLFQIVERDGAYFLVPLKKVHLGFPTKPLGKIYIDGDTFEMFKAVGVNFECATLTWDTTLNDYVLKPEKGGTGSLHNITITGDGSTRGISVEPTVSAVGIQTDPDTDYAASIGGDMQLDGQVYINPATALPPFVLNANAQGQLVTGLNAERLGGSLLSEIGSGSLIIDNTAQTVTGTTQQTTFWTTTLAGGVIPSAKRVLFSFYFNGSMGSQSILRIKYGSATVFQSDALVASLGNTWIDLELLWVTNSSQLSFARVISEIPSAVGVGGGFGGTLTGVTAIQLGKGTTASIDSTISQTFQVTIQPSGTGQSFTRKFAQLRRMS